MPLLHRARAAALTALLAAGCMTASLPAAAQPWVSPATPSCIQPGPLLRYLVVFSQLTTPAVADAEITEACGTTTVYYPEISVAVATSPDPSFLKLIGPQRAYSAQGESIAKRSPKRKKDDTELLRPAGARSGEQWDMDLIKTSAAHEITTGDKSVVVGVLDSGVDPRHPDLAGALAPELSAGCLTGKPDPSPSAWAPTTSAHGTHVAGTIAAADDGRGVTGVAPGVRIASVKVVDDEGFIYPEYAVCGFMWAASQNMTITNNSYFIDPYLFTCQSAPGQRVIYEAVRRAVDYATSRDVLTVAAAGNAAADLSRPGRDSMSPTNGDAQTRPVDSTCVVLPAQLKNVVGVSAVESTKTKAGYSSYGLGAIDVTAPGGDARTPAGCVLSTVPTGYDYSCGTSMAAPHAAGVAALIASTHPEADAVSLGRMLNAQAETLACPADYDLNGTGVQDAFCTGYSEYNSFYGHGLVDALAAVTK
ncbi:S8 family serine peptidase [Lentzea sp. DG1S-22]|uniref:S8 family peptidase n=1 Tax=Lentzea sp. DG1S-22 TaxID=3108822 RepID=UPI002E794B6B|nr:S8 family serine peptidase [Lentzea sp. DG1S-22]WVH77494.1 S8 family serine peptidase [Lentzea sp. DG1S-22]